MAARKAANLVDQFKSAPSLSSSSHASSVMSLPRATGGAAGVNSNNGLGQWFKKNWGKAAAIIIVVTVTTIFVVRTAVMMKNKKKQQKAEQAKLVAEQGVEWESFFEPPHVVRGAAPRPTMPQPIPPPFMPQQHALRPLPPQHHALQPQPQQPPPPPVPGFMPLPPIVNAATDAPNAVERGLAQQRLPPADGAQSGSGLGGGIMPESSRPIANATFKITSDLPIATGKEEEVKGRRGGMQQDEQTLPQEVDAPPTDSVEFK